MRVTRTRHTLPSRSCATQSIVCSLRAIAAGARSNRRCEGTWLTWDASIIANAVFEETLAAAHAIAADDFALIARHASAARLVGIAGRPRAHICRALLACAFQWSPRHRRILALLTQDTRLGTHGWLVCSLRTLDAFCAVRAGVARLALAINDV